jgi:hypothetical protein
VGAFGIDLNLRRDLRGIECGSKSVLDGGFVLIVVRRDGETETRFDLGSEQMRAIGFAGDQKADMEGIACAYPAQQVSGGFQNIRAAQTITVRTDLGLAIHMLSGV